MQYHVLSVAIRATLVVTGSTFLLAGLLAGSLEGLNARAAAVEGWPTEISAVYKIAFNGLDIGDFHFTSKVDSRGYTLDGSAELSILLGAYSWKGVTRSAGAVQGDAPKPSGYAYDFKSNSKRGSVKMNFNGSGVSDVSLVPPPKAKRLVVPVREQHLKGVLDPLSAVMALTRGSGGNPCGRRLAIFDGKQRFDLVMSYRRQQPVKEARPSGQPNLAFVCGMRYVPIAGHKPNEKLLSQNDNIEIALRPVPSLNLLVPYKVTIPTAWGPATLTSRRVDIITPKHGQIALIN